MAALKTYADAIDDQAHAASALARSRFNGIEPHRVGMVEVLTKALLEADTYFVTSEFMALHKAAFETMPSHELMPEDIPTPSGWVTLEEPVTVADSEECDAFLWTSMIAPGNKPILANVYSVMWTIFRGGLPDRTYEVMRGDATKPSQWLKALWLLMTQRNVAEIAEAALPRATRKRAERAHLRPSVRVVRLPRRERNDNHGHQSVDWQVRWIVSGHWRQQPWGPERKRTRPVWIAPYMKGPEDKPLVSPAHRLFVADTRN